MELVTSSEDGGKYKTLTGHLALYLTGGGGGGRRRRRRRRRSIA
jgi:hypothetical protein